MEIKNVERTMSTHFNKYKKSPYSKSVEPNGKSFKIKTGDGDTDPAYIVTLSPEAIEASRKQSNSPLIKK